MSIVDWVHGVLVPAARQSLEQITGQQMRRSSRGEWRARCPIHKGDDPNWSINAETLLWQCHSHCGGGDIIKLWACIHNGHDPRDKLRGAAWAEAVDDLAGCLGVARAADGDQSRRITTSHMASNEIVIRPAQEGVDAFWASLDDIAASPAAIAWLQSRSIPLHVARDHCRWWAYDIAGPAWAGWTTKDGQWRAWRDSGNAMVFGMYAADGRMADCRFRLAAASNGKWPPKSAGRSGGVTMANQAARSMLATGTMPAGKRDVVVCEGEPDYLSWCASVGDDAPVLGLVSGSVTDALISRIPAKARVMFDAHQDDAGGQYLQEFGHAMMRRGVASCVAIDRSK